MNTAPGFELEVERGVTYSVRVDGVVVDQFLCATTRQVGLAARGQYTAFVHEDGAPVKRAMKATVRRASPNWPHEPEGEALVETWDDILAAAPEGRYVLTCNGAAFDLWLGPAAD